MLNHTFPQCRNHLKNFRTGYGLAFQPDSIFAETFNQGIMEAAMTGHVDFWHRKALFEKKVAVTEAK